MKTRFLLVLGILALSSCTDEVELSTTESALTQDQLEGWGFTCTYSNPPAFDQMSCTKCIMNGPVVVECTTYRCPRAGGECTHESTYTPANTFDEDLNYWLEAEATNYYGSTQKVTDAEASAGSCLYIAGSGSTRAVLDAPIAATVYAWARVIAPSTSANSIYIQLDSQPVVLADLPVSTTWTWVPLGASWYLTEGSHYVRFYSAEVGVKVDRVLLTGNPNFVPVAQRIQAETAGLVAPMQLGTQRSIPMVGYIWVPNGAGTNGLAQFQVSMPYAGHYAVWGRINAPSEADNSFWLGKIAEPRTAWSVPVATSWRWHRATPTFALDDFDVLELAQREDGTKLDKIVITNDPGFTLVEPAPPVNSL